MTGAAPLARCVACFWRHWAGQGACLHTASKEQRQMHDVCACGCARAPVRAHAYMRTGVHACAPVCACVYMRAGVHACAPVHAHAYMHTGVHACVCAHVYVSVHAWVWVNAFEHMHKHSSMCIHITCFCTQTPESLHTLELHSGSGHGRAAPGPADVDSCSSSRRGCHP